MIATGFALLFGLVLVGSATLTLVTRSQIQQIDETLRGAHPPIEQLARAEQGNWPLIPQIAPGLYVAIVGRDDQVLFETAAQSPGEEPFTGDLEALDRRAGFQTIAARGDEGDGIRVRIDPLGDETILLIGQSLHEVNETRGRLVTALALSSLLAMTGVLLLSWWLVRISLRPLRRVESSAADITDQGLGDQRVPGGDEPTEVGNLARTLNNMLDRLDDARAEREQTMRQLQASEARMRRFVADASHELRTPLAATAAYAELFESGARERPEDLARSMAGIRSETARMAELIDDLLLLARLDERRPLARETADLTEIVLAAVDAARTLEPRRVVRPHINGVITTTGDPARLRQVIDNLLANVRTHTPDDTTCDITLSCDSDGVTIEVSDDGPGVTPEQLSHLGDRFYRADDARARATGGNGLGLSIASAIVAAHGGIMVPSSTEPTGLTITVRLPFEPPEPGG